MSHVVKIATKFSSIPALLEAAEKCGLQKLDKNTFNWYGRHVGDYPLPQGFTASDMGKCDQFALGLKDAPNAYEIGVCKARDGSDGYELLFDFWAGGYGLEEAIGEGGMTLCEEYGAAYAKQQLMEQGYIVTEEEVVEVQT